MRLTWKDGVATLLFAAIVVPYGFYLAWGGFTLIGNGEGGTAVGILDPTGMAALGLVLGVVAAAVGGWIVLSETALLGYLTGGLGLFAAVLGALALIGENLFNNATVWESVLGGFVATIVLLWAIAIGRHSGLFESGETRAPAGTT
jgi:hypothetical protein